MSSHQRALGGAELPGATVQWGLHQRGRSPRAEGPLSSEKEDKMTQRIACSPGDRSSAGLNPLVQRLLASGQYQHLCGAAEIPDQAGNDAFHCPLRLTK